MNCWDLDRLFFVRAVFFCGYILCIVLPRDCTYILLLGKFILFYSPHDYLSNLGISGLAGKERNNGLPAWI